MTPVNVPKFSTSSKKKIIIYDIIYSVYDYLKTRECNVIMAFCAPEEREFLKFITIAGG